MINFNPSPTDLIVQLDNPIVQYLSFILQLVQIQVRVLTTFLIENRRPAFDIAAAFEQFAIVAELAPAEFGAVQ